MATETLNIKVRETGSRKASAAIRTIAQEAARGGGAVRSLKKELSGLGSVRSTTTELVSVAKANRRVAASADTAALSIKGLSNQVFFAQRAFATLGGLFLARGFLQASDSYQNLTNRIKLTTSSATEFLSVQKTLEGISRSTRQSLTATTETYVRLRLATKNAGVSNERLFGVLETLNKMLAVSGASAIEAEQSIRQLSQAFSKGKLDGDEFRSVSEAMPSILTALQKSLGKTRGELRDMSEAGQLTTSVLIKAFEDVKGSADKDFANSIVTIGQSWQVLKDSFLKAIGEFNTSTGVIGTLVDSLLLLADNLWIVEAAVTALAIAMAVKMYAAIIRFATGLTGVAIPSLSALVVEMRIAMAATSQLGTISAASWATIATGIAAAGAAGFAFGSFLEDALDLSDGLLMAFGVLDATDFAKDMEHALFINRAIHKKELERLDVQKRLGTISKSELKTKVAQEEMEILLINSQLEQMANAKIQAVRDEIAAKHAAKQLKIQTESEAVWKKIRAQLMPIATAQQKLTAETIEMLTAMEALGASADQLFDARDRLRFLAKGAVDPITAELDKRRDALEIAKLQTAEAREKATWEKRSLDIVAQANALSPDTVAGGTRPELTAQVDALNKSAAAAAKRAKELSKKGGKSTKNLRKEYEKLLQSLDPVRKATAKVAETQAFLNKVSRKYSDIDTSGVMEKFTKTLEDQLNPLAALVRITQQHAKFAALGAEERSRTARTMELELDMSQKLGRSLNELERATINSVISTEGHTAAIEDIVSAHESLADSLTGRKALLESIARTQDALVDSSLSAAEKEQASLTNQLRLYPELTSLVEDQMKGLLGLDSAQRKAEESAQGIALSQNQANAAYKAGVIGQEVYRDVMSELARQSGEAADKQLALAQAARVAAREAAEAASIWGSFFELFKQSTVDGLIGDAITNAYLDMEAIGIDAIVGLETAMFKLATGADDAWASFTDGMQAAFLSMTESVLSDITRILVRMAILETFNLGGGAGFLSGSSILGLAHGGNINTSQLPRFAHGGGFQVGGAGGPDTKLVQFMASPGENIRVTNPGQSRLDNKNQAQQPQEQAGIVVNNIVDPNQAIAAMSSPQGVRVIQNVMIEHSAQFRRYLNEG